MMLQVKLPWTPPGYWSRTVTVSSTPGGKHRTGASLATNTAVELQTRELVSNTTVKKNEAPIHATTWVKPENTYAK